MKTKTILNTVFHYNYYVSLYQCRLNTLRTYARTILIDIELLNEILAQQAMFELIDRAAGLGEGFELDPDQKGTGNMIALDAGLAALAPFHPVSCFLRGASVRSSSGGHIPLCVARPDA